MAVPKNPKILNAQQSVDLSHRPTPSVVSWPPASSSYMERSFYDPAPDLAQRRCTCAALPLPIRRR